MDYRNAAAACYLEAKPESGYIWKPYKEKLGRKEKTMGIFDHYATGVKFTKTGAEMKAAIEGRLDELNRRLTKRDAELTAVIEDRDLLRSYLVRNTRDDFPHSSQLKSEMPSEEHQRITELCRRMNAIEEEMRQLCIVKDNLKDEQELELSFEDLANLGFGEEHYQTKA